MERRSPRSRTAVRSPTREGGASASKSRRTLWVDLAEVLADAIEATLPPRGDRDRDARLFPGSGADALRTSIAKACAALAIPLFSPHDLRHRGISLLHQQGPLMGKGRLFRRAAEALDHCRHVHACPCRRTRDRPIRSSSPRTRLTCDSCGAMLSPVLSSASEMSDWQPALKRGGPSSDSPASTTSRRPGSWKAPAKTRSGRRRKCGISHKSCYAS